MLLGHGLLVLDFFDHDYPKVLERVVVGTKMLVDFYGIFAFHVISMLIYTSVALLGFKLAHVLPTIGATVAPGEVDCVFGTTICFLANLELFSAGSVSEDIRIDNM